MSVRAKFTVQSHKEYAGPYGYTEVVLSPQYDMSIPEDQRYAKATPMGQISLTIDNPAASEQLALGKAFYVDFTPVE